jgi:hypothetical protein
MSSAETSLSTVATSGRMREYFTKKITASADAARKAWLETPKEVGPLPNITVGVYFPQNPLVIEPEIYTTISDGKDEPLFYFARDRQIFAVASFKCVKQFINSPESRNGNYIYEIVPSSEDIAMGRSPLRPIGCKVHEKDPISNFIRLYVIDSVEPFVSKAVGHRK